MARLPALGQLLLVSLAASQQVFIPTDGPTTRPQCKGSKSREPTYSFTPFSFTMTDTVRHATSVAPPTTTMTYAPPPASVTDLVPSLSYTTWGKWDPNAAEKATDGDDPYGQAAWTALWESANPPNFTETGVFSTTVSPTPVPSSELILPPKDYFGPTDCYNFPKGFQFGVACSAAQVEGAAADEGRAPTLSDVLIQDDRPKAYTTNEFYFYYKQDIERLAAMGVKYFSFSISWARILPFALPGTPVNQQGIDHYNDMINFILDKGMTPVATLLHFDTPLQFYAANLSATGDHSGIGGTNGGYQNETFPDAFVNYAKVAMSHFADRIPVWFTFNEPMLHVYNAKAVEHVVKSHARVYHFYKDELKGTGKVAYKMNLGFGVPQDPKSEADVYAANHFNSVQLGPLSDPILLGKDYPDSFKETYPDAVPFTDEDLAYIGHTADFIGVDPYNGNIVSAPVPGDKDSVLACAHNSTSEFRPFCANYTQINVHGWDFGYRSQSYVYTTPTYLRSYLNYLYNTWKVPIAVAEFGFPVYGESEKELHDQLFDTPRSQYYLSYMSEILKAIWEDGVEVMAAYAWSGQDNWEFGDYKQQFGLQTVNRTTQERRYKKSFFDLVDFMKARDVE